MDHLEREWLLRKWNVLGVRTLIPTEMKEPRRPVRIHKKDVGGNRPAEEPDPRRKIRVAGLEEKRCVSKLREAAGRLRNFIHVPLPLFLVTREHPDVPAVQKN